MPVCPVMVVMVLMVHAMASTMVMMVIYLSLCMYAHADNHCMLPLQNALCTGIWSRQQRNWMRLRCMTCSIFDDEHKYWG
eukprot:15463798-Alexandrium_andersonii.AAC.1